jgi:hypothetical protein
MGATVGNHGDLKMYNVCYYNPVGSDEFSHQLLELQARLCDDCWDLFPTAVRVTMWYTP